MTSTELYNWISFSHMISFFCCQTSLFCDRPPPPHSTQPSHSAVMFFFFRWTIRIMFNINLLENLKVYVSSRPPLVVFMISVSAMAIAFLTLGYFFKIKEIKSPEMTEVRYKKFPGWTVGILIWNTCTKLTSSFFPPENPFMAVQESYGRLFSAYLPLILQEKWLLVWMCE